MFPVFSLGQYQCHDVITNITFIFVLTDSMKENFSKSLKKSLAKKFAEFYGNRSFFAHFVSIIRHVNPVHSHAPYPFKINFSLKPSTPSSSKHSLTFMFFHQTLESLNYFRLKIMNIYIPVLEYFPVFLSHQGNQGLCVTFARDIAGNGFYCPRTDDRRGAFFNCV